jgi:glutaredoxin 3
MPQIEMYTTNYCPYCVRAKRLLKDRGVEEIKEIQVTDRTEVFKRCGRLSVPQIFIDDVHVGGFDDLVVWDKSGQLEKALAQDLQS